MRKPNVILIYCDELRTDALGCYGHPDVRMRTPHIDSIAGMGVRFTQCFCTSPVCVASRTSLLTGLYPEDTGIYHNEAYWPKFKLEETPLTFPEVFAQHGYVTANFGKAHIPRAFSPWNISDESGGGMHTEMDRFYANIEKYEVVFDKKRPWIIFAGAWPDELSYFSSNIVPNALRWLDTVDQPYLLRISFLQPHTPILVPKPFDELYNPSEFRDFNEWNPEASTFDRLVGEMCASDHQTTVNIQLMQAHYYGLVGWVDSQVGILLGYLRDKGQLENTVLIFESDHGVSLGEGYRYHKLTFAPEVHRVPRIISFPAELPRGKTSDELTQSIDLARTLFGLAGIHSPGQFKGRDLFSQPEPEAIYATIGFGWDNSYAAPFAQMGRYVDGHGWPRRSCIRTPQFRVDKNVRIDGQPVSPEHQDIYMTRYREDPKELKNLAIRPEYQEIVNKLSAKIDEQVSNSVEWPQDFVGRNHELYERNRALAASILSKKRCL